MAVRIRCNGCGYILATKIPLTDTVLTCPSCKGRFSIRRGCTHTASIDVERQPRPYQCKYCGESYGSPHGLRAHYTRRHADQYNADRTEQTYLHDQFVEAHQENKRWLKGQIT